MPERARLSWTAWCAPGAGPTIRILDVPILTLIVLWTSAPADIVDSPTLGRVGPLPFNRSGSHVHRGFLLAAGPSIPRGATLAPGQAVDIAPTILALMGAPIPAYCDGAPILAGSPSSELHDCPASAAASAAVSSISS